MPDPPEFATGVFGYSCPQTVQYPAPHSYFGSRCNTCASPSLGLVHRVTGTYIAAVRRLLEGKTQRAMWYMSHWNIEQPTRLLGEIYLQIAALSRHIRARLAGL